MQVITYKGYSFLRTQTPHVHPMSFSFHRQSATKPSFQQLDIVQLSSPALLSYLQERGINTALAKRECREAHFTNNDKRYFAIAFPNISGRYEIRNRYFKGCIAPKEISHIRQPEEQTIKYKPKNKYLWQQNQAYISSPATSHRARLITEGLPNTCATSESPESM